MQPPNRILVFQTAFLGDVVLTLPLVQVLHREFPNTQIDFLTTPKAAAILRNHPAINSVIEYDKRGSQRGLRGICLISRALKAGRYDVALVPHRSLRSAVVAALSGIPLRIGFDASAGRFLFSKTVPYERNIHEVERNLRFAEALSIRILQKELPSVYPSVQDVDIVDRFFSATHIEPKAKLIAIAPGSVWNTKRWLTERFSELVKRLSSAGIKTVLVGGGEDEGLCRRIAAESQGTEIYVAAGKFTLLQSAELLRRCFALVSNDSAPMHLAVAVRTPVVAVFGATVPSFGFAPYGEKDIVVQTEGLSCRPCSIHGGDKCPIGTFDCMVRISAEMVFEKVIHL